MAILDSIEVRWFGEITGSSHDDLERRLADLQNKGIDVDRRPDEYVRVPGSSDFGIKVRGQEVDKEGRPKPSRIELKGRTHLLGTQIFIVEPNVDLAGNVECWTKWSYEHSSAIDVFAADLRHVVKKTRCQVKYGWDSQFRLTRLASNKEIVTKGGAFEVTLADITDRSFWSVGIEAFPTDSETVSRFHEFVHECASFLVSEALVEVIPLAALTQKQSRSYPEWLVNLAST